MRGLILGVDRRSGDGQISGDDGKRYRFRPEDWADKIGPAVGALVDFDASEGRAVAVYRQPDTVPAIAQRSRRVRSDRNKWVAALFAFFFGIFGVHRFYLGKTASGIAMLVLTLTLVGVLVTGLWALVDCVRYLAMSHGEFEERYGTVEA